MDYVDLYLTSSEMNEKIEVGRRIGLKGLGFCISSKDSDKIDGFLDSLNALKSPDMDIISCIIIEAEGPKQMKNLVSKYRDKFEVVIVSGGDYSINRAAAEDSKVDILMHPEFRRNDSGLDHIIAKAAASNNVAIGFSFHSLLTTYKKIRAHILEHMEKNLMLCEKFNTPVIFASGARTKWDMRDMREMASLANTLGYPISKCVESVTTTPILMVSTNRKKLSGKMPIEGVEVV